MRKKKKTGRYVVGLLLIAGLSAYWLLYEDEPTADPPVAARVEKQRVPQVKYYPVDRVIDGDTIVVRDKDTKIRVRLIGVNTPETVHPNRPVEFYGKEASMFLSNLLIGERVRLERDPTNTERGHKDIYGRLLAYVYRDGLFVNHEILRQGYGVRTDFKHRYTELFKKAQANARKVRKGLWRTQ